MAILKHVNPAGSHICKPPKNPQEKYGQGTIWRCDACGKQCRLEEDQREGWIWVHMLKQDYIT